MSALCPQKKRAAQQSGPITLSTRIVSPEYMAEKVSMSITEPCARHWRRSIAVLIASLVLSGCGASVDPVDTALSKYHQGSSYADLQKYVVSIGGSCHDLPDGSLQPPATTLKPKPGVNAFDHYCDTPHQGLMIGYFFRVIYVRESEGVILYINVIRRTLGF
jgi:hypothetical protein